MEDEQKMAFSLTQLDSALEEIHGRDPQTDSYADVCDFLISESERSMKLQELKVAMEMTKLDSEDEDFAVPDYFEDDEGNVVVPVYLPFHETSIDLNNKALGMAIRAFLLCLGCAGFGVALQRALASAWLVCQAASPRCSRCLPLTFQQHPGR